MRLTNSRAFVQAGILLIALPAGIAACSSTSSSPATSVPPAQSFTVTVDSASWTSAQAFVASPGNSSSQSALGFIFSVLCENGSDSWTAPNPVLGGQTGAGVELSVTLSGRQVAQANRALASQQCMQEDGTSTTIKQDYQNASTSTEIASDISSARQTGVSQPTPTTAPPAPTTTITTPPTTSPTTKTTPPQVFPPTTMAQARALARIGDSSGFSFLSTQSNELPPCPNVAIRVVIPSGLSDQQLAADFLHYFFNADEKHGCGDVDIDGYLSPGDADPNGPNSGMANGGAVIDNTDPSRSSPSSLSVGLPDGTHFDIG